MTVVINRPFEAYLDEYSLITVLIPKSSNDNAPRVFTLAQGDKLHGLEITNVKDVGWATKYECTPHCFIEIGQRYNILETASGTRTDLQIGRVVRTPEFDNYFYYDGDDLGVTYTPEKTIWKVWAPTAEIVKLRYVAGHDMVEHSMKRQDKGVWSLELEGDCEDINYEYLTYINSVWRAAVDPYSVSTTSNSKYSVVIDLNKTWKIPSPPAFSGSATDAIIYEAHIRDLTVQCESIENRGTFRGLVETIAEDEYVGIPYIKDLGVTHLELLPFNDFGGVDEEKPFQDYNWGYNPMLYNSPEGSYSTDPNDPYCRINELKELIGTLHENNLRVIQDVVHNHVYLHDDCPFESLVPGYYFRYYDYNIRSNGTGVGNDIASERLMARKFIVDSVKFWATEYKITGFRFDLMGISDVETMNEVRKALDEIDPTIIVLGEGWNLNTPLAHESKAATHNAWRMPGIAFFNDYFRDNIKGNTFDARDKGFAFGDINKTNPAKYAITGCTSGDIVGYPMFTHPSQTVNYVECHDNATMWDKLTHANHHYSEEYKKDRHRMATSFVLLSQGIPFLHAGQEFFRTKHGNDNSYNAPDYINQMDWTRRDQYMDNVKYVRELIRLRKSHGAFRLATGNEVKYHVVPIELNSQVMGYGLRDVKKYGKWNEILVFFNTSFDPISFNVEGEEWTVLAQGGEINSYGIRITKEPYVQLSPQSVTVLAKEK